MHRVAHVRLTCSGTMGVQLGLAAVNLQAGDEVILAGYDFPGNFRAIEQLGGFPVLVDVDIELRIGLEQLEAARSAKTRAIIVSHLHGSLADMRGIMGWAREHEVAVVEDACQAPGANVQGRLAGTWGDVGVHSFGGSKLITAGRGGAVITDDAVAAQRMTVYAEQGNDAYPLSELQAAVLVPQLARLSDRNQARQAAAAQLYQLLADHPQLRMIGGDDLHQASYYKIGIALGDERLQRQTRDEWTAAARQQGIPLDAGFRSFTHRSRRRCRQAGSLEQSHRAGTQLAVLHHPILLTDPQNLQRIAAALHSPLDAT